jgi:hypothetical protein
MDYLSPQDKPHFLGFVFKRLVMVEVTLFHKKHIMKIEFLELYEATNGVLSLVELPFHIDYFYKINGRRN